MNFCVVHRVPVTGKECPVCQQPTRTGKRVYVAGPYTLGDAAINVRNAINTATLLLENGYYPFVPHLFHFWHIICPKDYELWFALDAVFLSICDAVLRIPGQSHGAEREVVLAGELGIPVFNSHAELNAYFKTLGASEGEQ